MHGRTQRLASHLPRDPRWALAAAGALIAAAGVAAWALARRDRRARERAAAAAAAAAGNGAIDRVEEASLESFPASDSPGWGGAAL